MLIIVEGPDCVGKSTFIDELSRHVTERRDLGSMRVLHRSQPTSHPLDEYVLPLLNYAPRTGLTGEIVICDRWHLGELVYPRVMGRATQFTTGVLRYVELFLASRGAVLVTMTSPTERIQRCIERRGDTYVTPEHAEALRVGFLDAEARTRLPLLSLDEHSVKDPTTLYLLIDQALAYTARAETRTNYVTFVGTHNVKLLLLGDVRATGADPLDSRPAFMPYPATSGHYMLETLGDALPHEVALANACDVDDPRWLWQALGQPRTVALGRNAQRAASWATDHAPHPQWWRRFRHHDRDEYRQLLLGESFVQRS